jgi:limonene-1,2-epoxide hydrolase
MNVASFFRVNANGMITEMRNYFDTTTFMEQTGIDLVSMQK